MGMPDTSFCDTSVEAICQDTPQYCALGGASHVFTGIRKALVITHAASGCAWITRWVRSDNALGGYSQVLPTSLFEKDIIFGGKAKLKASMSWAIEKWHSPLVCVINGCTGSLINDPVDAVAAELEKKYNVPIIFVDSAGFKGLAATGGDDAYAALLKKLAQDDVERDESAVNLIGPQFMGSSDWVYDLEEMRRLIELLGLRINCVLTFGTEMADIKGFNRAATDIHLSYEAFPQLAEYEDERQIRRIGASLPLPVGVANTEEWFFGLAEEFGKREEAEAILKQERKHLKPLQFHYNGLWLNTWLANQRAAVIGPATWAAAMARCLYYDFAVIPGVIGLYGETPECFQAARESLEEVARLCEPVILDNPLGIRATAAVRDNTIEFAVGQSQDKSMMGSIGIPHLSLAGQQAVFGAFNFIPYPSMGFKGVPYLMSHLGKLLEDMAHEPQRWQELRFRSREEGATAE